MPTLKPEKYRLIIDFLYWNEEIIKNDEQTGWTPVHELDVPLGLDQCNGRVHVFRHHIAPVEQTTGHVLAIAWVAFDHLGSWFETLLCDLGNLNWENR
jgi:hypothetical protein